MDEVECAFAHESIAVIRFRKGVAAVNRDSGCSREIAGRAATTFHRTRHDSGNAPPGTDDAPGFFETDAIDFGRRTIGGYAGEGRWHVIKRITRSIALLIHE